MGNGNKTVGESGNYWESWDDAPVKMSGKVGDIRWEDRFIEIYNR